MTNKNIILTSLALLSFTFANAQTVNTEVGSGSAKKVERKPAQPTTESRAERSSTRMRNDLTLNEEQYTKVLSLKKETFAQFKTIAEKNPGTDNRDARVAALKPLRDSYVKSLKAILTTDQNTKYETGVKTRFEAWKKAAYAQPNAPKPDDEEQLIKLEME